MDGLNMILQLEMVYMWVLNYSSDYIFLLLSFISDVGIIYNINLQY